MDDESVPVQVRLEVPYLFKGALAQLGERLPCTQEVRGSSPLGSTNIIVIMPSKLITIRLLVFIS